MTTANNLRFINYQVLKVNYELNDKVKFQQGKFDIKPQLHRSVHRVDDQRFGIKLSVEISSDINQMPIPFHANISLVGFFELTGWEAMGEHSDAMHQATSMLYPYLRQLLTTTTLNANITPYTLPVMDVGVLFPKDKKA